MMIKVETAYLTDMPNDIINEYGLSKTLLTRRDTIYLKHVMKNIFLYGNEYELEEKLEMLQFKSLFKYIEFLTNKLRMIYKIPRNVLYDDVDIIVKTPRSHFIDNLELYKQLNPLVVLDFDHTITNKRFHTLYNYLTNNNYKIIINSANPNQEAMESYLNKYNLSKPYKIYANKGKKKKIVNLKAIAYSNIRKPIFFIDDEREYLEYGCLLLMYCYRYAKSGKMYNTTIFQK